MKASAAWPRMPAAERWLNHGATAALAITGLALAVMRYALPPPDDPFAGGVHRFQPQALDAHVLAAPVGIAAVALVLRHHAIARLRDPAFRRSRRSGWALVLTAAPMIASAALLQVTTSEPWRRAWAIAHLATGCAWVLGWAAHFGSARGWLRRVGR